MVLRDRWTWVWSTSSKKKTIFWQSLLQHSGIHNCWSEAPRGKHSREKVRQTLPDGSVSWVTFIEVHLCEGDFNISAPNYIQICSSIPGVNVHSNFKWDFLPNVTDLYGHHAIFNTNLTIYLKMHLFHYFRIQTPGIGRSFKVRQILNANADWCSETD